MACAFVRARACVTGDMGQRLRNDFVPSFELLWTPMWCCPAGQLE